MKPERASGWLWAAAVVVGLVLAACNIRYGDLNQDEGWYLYAARLVAEGQVPYRDFAFTQGPVMAYGYALADPIVQRWGVAGGRVFTALLGLAAAAVAAALAARLAPRGLAGATAFLAFCFIGLNVYQSYFTSVVKTYALGGLLLTGGLLCLTWAGRRRGGAACVAAGCLLALSACTRASAGALLPVVFLALIVRRRACVPLAWFWFAAGAGLTGAALCVPFFVMAPEGFLFGVVHYHAGRSAGGLLQALVYKLGFVSRVVQAYYPALAAVALALGARWLIRRPASSPGVAAGTDGECDRGPVWPSLWWGVAAVTLVHLMAPFPYDDYQAMIFPLFAAGAGVRVAREAGDRAIGWAMLAVFLLGAAAAFSSPINQSWFVQGRDRIWWLLKDETPIERLQRAARRIRELSPDSDLLLTQDTYLAVESGKRMHPGLELGPFSYFPDLTTEEAQARRVVNGDLLRRALEQSEAPLAAFSGYSLAIRCPEVAELSGVEQRALWEIVERRYAPVEEIPDFGQAFTTLRILSRRRDSAAVR